MRIEVNFAQLNGHSNQGAQSNQDELEVVPLTLYSQYSKEKVKRIGQLNEETKAEFDHLRRNVCTRI